MIKISDLEFEKLFKNLYNAFSTISEKQWSVYYGNFKNESYETMESAIKLLIRTEDRCTISKLYKCVSLSRTSGTLSKSDMLRIKEVCDLYEISMSKANYILNQEFCYNRVKGYTFQSLPISLVDVFCEYLKGKMEHERSLESDSSGQLATPAEIKAYFRVITEVGRCHKLKVATSEEMMGFIGDKINKTDGDMVEMLDSYVEVLKKKRGKRHGERVNGVYVNSVKGVE